MHFVYLLELPPSCHFLSSCFLQVLEQFQERSWQSRCKPVSVLSQPTRVKPTKDSPKKWSARWVPSSFFAIPFGSEVQPEWFSHNYFQKQTEHLAISPTSRTSRKHSAMPAGRTIVLLHIKNLLCINQHTAVTICTPQGRRLALADRMPAGRPIVRTEHMRELMQPTHQMCLLRPDGASSGSRPLQQKKRITEPEFLSYPRCGRINNFQHLPII